MDKQKARQLLADWNNEEEGPSDLPASVLPKLTIEDLPDGAKIQIGTMKEGVTHLDWNGTLGRDGNKIYGEADHTWTRKYCLPLGLEQYLDLVRQTLRVLCSARHAETSRF